MWELHTHFLTNADGDADGGQSILHIAPFHNVGTRPIATFWAADCSLDEEC